MGRRRLMVGLCAVGAAAALAAGCGGGGGGSSSTESATTTEGPSAETWASGFCNAFSDWINTLKSFGQSVQEKPTKATLQSAADEIQSANDTLVSDLQALGKPALPRGQDVKNVIDKLADQIKEDSDAVKKDISSLSSSVGDIATAVGSITTTLTQLQTQVNDATSQLKSISEDTDNSLKQALTDSSACKSLTGRS